MATALVLCQSTASSFSSISPILIDVILTFVLAEFRGKQTPDDEIDEFDTDLDHRMSLSQKKGRIIILGDGTEVLTDTNDSEIFDEDSEEDQDLERQATKLQAEREDTPGPHMTYSDTAQTNDDSVRTDLTVNQENAEIDTN